MLYLPHFVRVITKLAVIHENLHKMKNILLISVLILLISCNENKKRNNVIGELPKVQNIDSLNETDFVGTIENTFYEPKNYIYSPTLAFAWNEIQEKLKDIKITENKGIRDLMLLNNTKTNRNSLDKDEYKSEISINGDEIIAKSEFNLQLTFEPYLEKLEYPITFKNNEVEGFGMIKWDELKAKQLEIIYFEDNNNFIFKLTPKESNNELIFIRGLNTEKANSFKEVFEILSNKKELAKSERKNKNTAWKYKLEYDETFSIPELSFNIEKSFKSLIGQNFTSQNIKYVIAIAKQRNAILLNNKGAKIESEPTIAVACTDASDEPIKITKHLTLDNTFFLIIKHCDKENPYFCAKIDNTELMNKRITK
jgi:hypothetical protein